MQKINILIVEDNPADVCLVIEALNFESIPHALEVIEDGAEAMAFVDRMGGEALPCPDLIMLDLNLPKVSGMEVLAKIRQHCKGAETPVIVYSSSVDPADRARAEQFNVRFFRKPIKIEEWMELGPWIRNLTRT